MKENQRKEHRFNCNFIQEEGLTEILKKGSLLGMIMFISSLVTLSLAATEGLETFWSLRLVILLCYLAAGCLLQLIRGFTPQLDSAWFRGAAAVSWCYLLLFFLSFLTWRLPSFVRAMLLTSAAVLLLLMEAEYRYLKKVAKDLNSSAAGRTLIIDLDEKPRSPEAFFDLLETYCRKSSVTLEYVKKDIPATVKLEGRLHTVALTESYMYGGPVWSMEIREIL